MPHDEYYDRNLGRIGELTYGNCFRYAFNDKAKDNEIIQLNVISIPDECTFDNLCRLTTEKVIQMSGVRLKTRKDSCTDNEYEVLLVISMCNRANAVDIHWFRKDDDKKWSHKRGLTLVQMGIDDPISHLESENYVECNRFCVTKPGIDLDPYYN